MIMPEIKRRNTRTVDVGGVPIGGSNPVVLQSMTDTKTSDVEATLKQITDLASGGADIVRVATPHKEDTAALVEIVKRSPVPIVADIHFSHKRALEAIAAGVAKIRLNPGNIEKPEYVREIIEAADRAGAAIRIGVNSGSIVPSDQRDQVGSGEIALVDIMVTRMGEYLEIFEDAGFENLVLSAKSPDALTVIEVNRIFSEKWDYPLHLGLTHSGTPRTGTIRSVAALGSLLSEGIGDTIRISFAGDPCEEIVAGRELLSSLRLRQREGVELIACPTCGRLQTDMSDVIGRLEDEFEKITTSVPITVAVMGCVVNGPGEAADTDIALCAGKNEFLLYLKGKAAGKIAPENAVESILAEIERLSEEK